MSGSHLLDVIRRRRWVIVVVGVAIAFVIVSVARSPALYESSSTSVVRAASIDENDQARSLASLSRSDKIGSTYAFLAESELIEKRALDSLSGGEFGPSANGDIEIQASVIPGSNLIEIQVSAGDPDLAADVALAVGDELGRHVSGLGELYEIVALDPPTVPMVATRSSPGAVGLVGALMAGLVLAAIVVLAAERWWGLSRRDLRSDMHSAEYGDARIDEEKSRTDCGGPPFRLATMTVTVFPDPLVKAFSRAMSSVERRVERSLRPEDHLVLDIGGGQGTFRAILPQRDEADTAELLVKWRDLATRRLGRRFGTRLEISVDSRVYHDQGFVPDDDATVFARSV